MRKGKIENSLKKNQYELYSFSLPLSVVNLKNRKKLVEQQLEKNHPLFSGRFFTYAKYRIKNRKLFARVAVIDSKIFSECRAKTSAASLTLEGTKFKIPVSKKRLLFRFGLCAVVFVLVTGGLVLKNTVSPEKNVPGVENVQRNSDKEESMLFSFNPPVTETVEQLFERVYENSGFLSAFEWNGERCSFTIHDCHPESVIFDRPCAVSYKNRSPSFSVSIDCSSGAKECLDAALESREFIGAFREKLENTGAVIQTEICDMEKIDFRYFTDGENFRKILEMTCDYLNVSFWHEASLCVESAANGIFVSASFEKGIVTGSAVSRIVCDYASLFRLPAVPELKKNPAREKTVKSLYQNEREKLGEIRRGKEIFIYWKSGDGKIVMEKKRV